MQRVGPAAEFLQGYLTRVDPQYAAEMAATLGELRGAEGLRSRSEWDRVWGKVKAPIEIMERRFVGKETSYVARSGEKEWLQASGHARMLRQAVQVYTAGLNRDPSPRDRFMAENIEWIRKQEGANARMLVWAHNGHVALSGGSMGSHLRKSGVGVVAVGFVFNQGSFGRWIEPQPRVAMEISEPSQLGRLRKGAWTQRWRPHEFLFVFSTCVPLPALSRNGFKVLA